MDSRCRSMNSDKKTLSLRSVALGESGQGLPYAPQDWPNPGDIWGWKAGARTNSSGFMADRYLYLPSRLQNIFSQRSFNSKSSVQVFVRREFPEVDIEAFFSSFSWKIPSRDQSSPKMYYRNLSTPVKLENDEWESESESEESEDSSLNLESGIFCKQDKSELPECTSKLRTSSSKAGTNIYGEEVKAEQPGSLSILGIKPCKAGNAVCSIHLQKWNFTLPAMECDICCSETNFCRSCSCILCGKSIDRAFGGYSYIRCEAVVDKSSICGHVAHIECGLRSYMCGTVGGSIGLNVEYFCRRCDKRTDLTSHVLKIVCLCESLHTREDVEKILKLGRCIVGSSQLENAKGLLQKIRQVMGKFNLIPDYGRVPEVVDTIPGKPVTTQDTVIDERPLHNSPAKPPVELSRKRPLPVTRAKSSKPFVKQPQFLYPDAKYSPGEKGFIIVPGPLVITPLTSASSPM